MPIAKVQGPDNKVYRFEVPEGATPQEIEAFAQETIGNAQPEQPAQQTVTPTQAFTAGMVKGIPFGADITSAVAAGLYDGDKPGTFSEKMQAEKAKFENIARQGAEQHPYLNIAGNLTTGIPAGIALTPAKALQGASVAARAVKGGIAGGAFGALYGAGEGDSLNERAANSIYGGVLGVPIGVGGSLLADTVGLGYKATRGLAQKAASLFKGAGQPPASAVNPAVRAQQGVAIDVQPAGIGLGDVQDVLTNATPNAPLSMDTIPLTKGQATQNASLQSLESGAAAGAYGEQAQIQALKARELQAEAARNRLEGVAQTDLLPETAVDTSASLIKTLQGSYAAAKARTNAAYKKVGDLSQDAPLQIAADYVRDAVVPSIKDWARKGSSGRPWDLMSADMANAKRLYDQAAKIGDMKKLTGVNFFRMEDWRGRVSQGIANSKTPAEKAFLSGLLQRYDTAMGQLPREAIKSGDDAILTAMETARGARKAQGVLFERSKLVKSILENENLTNEQFANTLNSLGDRTGSYVRDILKTAANNPEKQAALRLQIKQSIMGSILNKSMSAEVSEQALKSGNVQNMISFDKLATNLEKFTKNKTLFNNVIPDKTEQAAVLDILHKSKLIKSAKPGSKNYSNTAYTLLNILSQVSPALKSANVFGVGAGSALKAMGESGAELELNQALAPVLKGVMQEHNGVLTNFSEKYGRQVINSGLLSAQRPFLKDNSGTQYNYPEKEKQK